MAAGDRPHVSLETTQSRAFGHGWISGVLSAMLGAIGLGAVLCFLFPTWLTTPELRALYPIPYVRALLHLVLVTAFLLGTFSICLRYNKALGLVGIGFTLIAALLGGSQVSIRGELSDGPFLGLDWFLLNLIIYSAVYVPLERLFAHRPEQPTFRKGWRTDLTYFFLNSLLVQLMTLLTMRPAMVLFDWARIPVVTAWVSRLPFPAQVLGVLLIADLTQYWVHRAFHHVPFLWRFHAVHHSAEEMDWLAGSRIHLVDAVVTRGATYVPIYVLGFSGGGAVYLRRGCGDPGDVHPRQRALGAPPSQMATGDAVLPPLAPHRPTGRPGQELRGAHAGLGLAVRHLPHAGPLAG